MAATAWGSLDTPLAAIQEEVRFLKRWQNCDSISIAGGEPLSHPRIADIVAFIREQGLKPFMLTNGSAQPPSGCASCDGPVWLE